MQIVKQDQQRSQQQQQLQKKQIKISKKQQKKLKKKQQWDKHKLIKRVEKRKQLKQKKIKKNNEFKLMKKQLQIEIPEKKEESNKIQEPLRRRKEDYMERMKSAITVVIDLQFYDLMREKQQNSLIKQLSYCHSANRRYKNSFNFVINAVTEKKRQFLNQKYNANNWGISIRGQSILELYQRQDLIYLTGDAQQQLDQFKNNKIYVIGGIVDHNRMKCLTYNWALQHKIQARRLPLKSIKLCASVHLAVNHVWEWMLAHYNGIDWDTALEKVIPSRKIAHN